MATNAPISAQRAFATTFAAYHAATLLRDVAKGDAQVERAEDAIAPLFHAVIEQPAVDLSSAISKLGALVCEYADGECPTDLVAVVLHDLIALTTHTTN